MKLKVIYEPRGAAREYGEMALNVYNGCSNGCVYCFAPDVLKKDRELFHAKVEERANFLSKVESDCKSGLLDGKVVHLSFVCDPYPEIEKELEVTRNVLKLFQTYGISFQMLTKGGTLAVRDFDLYKPGDAFGSTLTFVHEADSLKWEPKAALPKDRLFALKEAHNRGIKTWVSLEPVVDPNQTLELIKVTKDYVDLYKVGTINYHELKDTIDWNDFGTKAIASLEKYKKEYLIKNSLKAYL